MASSKKRVLVIGSTRHFCLSVVTSLGLAGWKSEVMTSPALAPVRFSRYCKRFTALPAEFDGLTPPQMLEYLRPHIRADHAAVIPIDVPSILAIGHGLGTLPCPTYPLSPPDVIDLLHDKHRFGQLLESHGLPTPKTRLIHGMADIDRLDIAFPAMLKPLAANGSVGVKKFETLARLREHVAAIPAEAFPQLVQEFAAGDLIGLNVLSVHGRVVAWTVQNHGFPGTNYTMLRNDRVLEVGREICRITGFHGLANFDTIHNPITGDVRFLECNPRTWASTIVSTWMGVNFPHLALLTALGEDVESRFQPVTGHTQYVKRFPFKLMLENLLRFRIVPPGLSPQSVAAYKHALTDLLPHIVDRLVRSPAPAPGAAGAWTEPAERFQTKPFCPELPPGAEDSSAPAPASIMAPKPGLHPAMPQRQAQNT